MRRRSWGAQLSTQAPGARWRGLDMHQVPSERPEPTMTLRCDKPGRRARILHGRCLLPVRLRGGTGRRSQREPRDMKAMRLALPLLLALAGAGCATYKPQDIRAGQSEAELQSVMGQPTGRYPGRRAAGSSSPPAPTATSPGWSISMPAARPVCGPGAYRGHLPLRAAERQVRTGSAALIRSPSTSARRRLAAARSGRGATRPPRAFGFRVSVMDDGCWVTGAPSAATRASTPSQRRPREQGAVTAPITLYGIANCDTVKRAPGLARTGRAPTCDVPRFQEGRCARARPDRWLDRRGRLGRRCSTARAPPGAGSTTRQTATRWLDATSARALMLAQSSAIKRPVSRGPMAPSRSASIRPTGSSASGLELEEGARDDRAVDAQVHLMPAGVVAARRHRAQRMALLQPDVIVRVKLQRPALEDFGRGRAVVGPGGARAASRGRCHRGRRRAPGSSRPWRTLTPTERPAWRIRR